MNEEAIQYIDVSLIDGSSSLRHKVDESVGLARSIQEVGGLLQPIRVRQVGGRYSVVDGDRRLVATMLARGRLIAAIVESKELSDAEVLHRKLICDLQRKELTAVERAQAIHRLIEETGWQPSEAAGKCGITNGTVTKLLAVLSLPEPILEKVNAGQIPVTAGYALARIADAAKQAALAQQIAEGNLTRDKLIETLKAERTGRAAKKAAKKHRVTVPLARGESVTVASPRLSIERIIEVAETLLAMARQAQARGVPLETFVRTVRHDAKTTLAQA